MAPQDPSEDQQRSSTSEPRGEGGEQLHEKMSPGTVMVLPETGATRTPTYPQDAASVETPQIERVFPIRIQRFRKRVPFSSESLSGILRS